MTCELPLQASSNSESISLEFGSETFAYDQSASAISARSVRPSRLSSTLTEVLALKSTTAESITEPDGPLSTLMVTTEPGRLQSIT